MGENELKIALQHQGDEHIKALWGLAEQLVAERRCAIDTELSALREESNRQLQIRVVEQRSSLLHEAQTRARESLLHAEAKLGSRLLALAKGLLPEVSATDSQQLWERLYDELPQAKWQEVRVCTDDMERTRQRFPTAQIAIDDDLGGGLIVTTAEGLIQVDNSLRCRLQRAWSDLLPSLLAEFRTMVENDETADSDTSN